MSKYNLYVEDVSVEAVFNKLGGVTGAKRFLADELVLREMPKSEPAPEPVIDSVIRVDRSVKLVYPDWMKKVMHLEFENTGPAEYDGAKLEQWLHDGQKDGWVKGQKIYEHLKKERMLETCIGFADLLEIQKKGIVFFRKHFQGKAVFGWRSVMQHRDDCLRVPCLCEDGDRVVLDWGWLENDWRDYCPALRFAS